MKIGILSDTHGLLRPEVLRALEGCGAVLHGGDVGGNAVLARLGEIAPVYAVRGNADSGEEAKLPASLDVTVAGLRVFVTHKRKDLPADLAAWDLAVCGHSHRWACERAGRTLVVNPGSCGPRRFRLPVTLALLDTEAAELWPERVDLGGAGETPAAPPDVRQAIETVLRETDRGRSPADIAARHRLDPALAEQIARLYVTHPGVSAEGIMAKMGL